ncbi:MAG TPA: VacJ family lipoprotein [Stellaceae bacterium]|nr:VacJ family lipoprotein [Stellaceae bacterium]
MNDPLEPMNRVFFDFDMFLDRILLKPAAQVYVAVIPKPGRRAVRNVLNNMNEPIVFANNMLQGQFHRADITVGRFLLNSTFGIAGIFDWATGSGLPRQNGDFGQTLYVWGFASGPYLFLPLLGPSNPRDAIGYGVDSYADPVGYAFWNAGGLRWLSWTRYGIDTVDSRSQQLDTLDELQKTSIDFYATIRSLSRQHREIELHHGVAQPLPKLESDEFDEPEDKPAKPAATPSPKLQSALPVQPQQATANQITSQPAAPLK